MDRNREVRRGSMAAVNGGGYQKRRPRSNNSLRDSPEEDGSLEMTESGRLRDRGVGKKERDRDRSGRNKKRRGERILHGGNREEGEDTSEDSAEDDDEDEEDEPPPPPPAPSAVRVPPTPAVPNASPASSSMHRKSFPAKVVRAPALWKVTDEMIGVSVPRKARSNTASSKRSHEWLVSGGGAAGGGGGGGGGGEPMTNHHRQTSTSPARHSPASTAPISPSSSNASVRKKMKPMSGSKHRPPKIAAKSPSSVQDIEFEVAEVLFGMTRQFQGPAKTENKEANGSSSRVSSPNSTSQPIPPPDSSALPPATTTTTGSSIISYVAPKRKKPRQASNIEEGTATNQPNQAGPTTPSTAAAAAGKMDGESTRTTRTEEKSTPLMENGSHDSTLHKDGKRESAKPSEMVTSDSKALVPESKEGLDANFLEPLSSKKTDTSVHGSRGEKFKFDLMSPPSTKSPPEAAEALADFSADLKPTTVDDNMGKRSEKIKTEEDAAPKPEIGEFAGAQEKNFAKIFEAKGSSAEKEKTLEPQPETEKTDEDVLSSSKQQKQQHQTKLHKSDKGQPTSIPLPMGVAGWPGGLPPPIGYIGQVPSLQAAFPMDGSNGGSKVMQPPSLPSPTKRCATHCHIAQNIYYHQQFTRMNPFWAAAPGTVPLFGAKPYSLNPVQQPSETILSYPGRSLGGTVSEKAGPVPATFAGHSSKEKNSMANNFLDGQQRKPHGIQPPPQGVPTTSNIMQAPAFIFPLNQQQHAAAAGRSGSGKPSSGTGAGIAHASSIASNSVPLPSGTSSASGLPPVGFNYTNLSANEAQYLAILHNNGYFPAHVGATPQYRGNHAQAMPFFNAPFYTSQMVHPSQLQQQAQNQHQHGHSNQPGHPNASNSSGSTSSQKHLQQQQQQQQHRIPGATAGGSGGGASHGLPISKPRQHLPPHTARQLEGEAGGEESPSTADSRVSQVQKGGGGMYAPNFTVPLNPQEYAMMAHAAAMGSSGGGGGHTEKHHHPASSQQQPQAMKIDLTQSQPFAMSFAAFNGTAAASVPPTGLDFSNIAQGHVFQNIPEAARHSYQMVAAAVAAQNKKPHHIDDAKVATGESVNTNAGEEERKMVASGGKPQGGFSQQSLSFSRADCDSQVTTILSNNVVDSSRTLNLITNPMNGSRPSSAVSCSTGVTTSNASHSGINQHQQHLIQMRKHQHQQLQMQQQLAPRPKLVSSSNTANVYSDRLPLGAVVTKFPTPMGGFPQGLVQGNAPPNQASQWKNSAQTSSGMASPTPKNHIPQQQVRSSQSPLSGHQMQISFSSNSQKLPSNGQQQQLGNSSTSTPIAIVGSPQASVSKSAGGSPRSSSGSKVGPSSLHPPPPSAKGLTPASSRKSSPVSNRNAPSILGTPTGQNSSSNKTQQHHSQSQQQLLQQQQQQLQKHPYPQPQLFFSSAYLPVQSSQTNVTAGYYHRRPLEQQQQQPNSTSSSTGMLSLCQPSLTLTGTSATSDPAKVVAAAAAKGGLPPTSLLQSAQLAAVAQGGGTHPLMSAPGFPYIHAMPSMSVKQADQKQPSSGNDNLHACWQPEKR